MVLLAREAADSLKPWGGAKRNPRTINKETRGAREAVDRGRDYVIVLGDDPTVGRCAG